ncbi:MAG: hypothetical protein WC671_00055 [Candidatus Paceibacterota bacterium]|jgi:hypothetical protein
MPNKKFKKAKAKAKTKEEEDFEDDDCEICKLMKTGNATPEALEKAFSLQNFLNNFPKDKGEKK